MTVVTFMDPEIYEALLTTLFIISFCSQLLLEAKFDFGYKEFGCFFYDRNVSSDIMKNFLTLTLTDRKNAGPDRPLMALDNR